MSRKPKNRLRRKLTQMRRKKVKSQDEAMMLEITALVIAVEAAGTLGRLIGTLHANDPLPADREEEMRNFVPASRGGRNTTEQTERTWQQLVDMIENTPSMKEMMLEMRISIAEMEAEPLDAA